MFFAKRLVCISGQKMSKPVSSEDSVRLVVIVVDNAVGVVRYTDVLLTFTAVPCCTLSKLLMICFSAAAF